MIVNDVKILKIFFPKFNCLSRRVKSTTNIVEFGNVNIKIKIKLTQPQKCGSSN